MKNKVNFIYIGALVLLSIVFYLLNKAIPDYSFTVLEGANIMMFTMAFGTHLIVSGQTKKAPGAFIRGVMGATFLKLMICMTAALIFIILNRNTLYKPIIFVLFGIYAVYTAIETTLLTRMAKVAK